MDLFRFTPALGEAAPVLVNVPHAGEHEPLSVTARALTSYGRRKRDFDLYVDQIWQDVPQRGIALMAAHYTRYCVDLNRSPDDVDAGSVHNHPNPKGTFKRGLLWQITAAGETVLAQPLSEEAYQERLDLFHTPYHQHLQATLDDLRSRFGAALLIDGHSMPSVGRRGHTDSGTRRADIVPGDHHGRACPQALTDLCIDCFSQAGYTVALNQPYSGGWITRHYGQPEHGISAIQIEVNRDLYMDESTFDIKTEGLQRLREACTRFALQAARWQRDQLA